MQVSSESSFVPQDVAAHDAAAGNAEAKRSADEQKQSGPQMTQMSQIKSENGALPRPSLFICAICVICGSLLL
jgi:hypothetical protein